MYRSLELFPGFARLSLPKKNPAALLLLILSAQVKNWHLILRSRLPEKLRDPRIHNSDRYRLHCRLEIWPWAPMRSSQPFRRDKSQHLAGNINILEGANEGQPIAIIQPGICMRHKEFPIPVQRQDYNITWQR